MKGKYPKKLYCDKCKKQTTHRAKLGAVLNGCLVCNVCDRMNLIKPKQR